MALFERIHAHVPYPALRGHLALLAARRLHPEIYVPQGSLGALLGAEGEDLAAALAAAGLRTTVHAPFADLSPGASDPAFRALTLEKLRSTLTATIPFAPARVVVHPGFDPLRYGAHAAIWRRNSLRTWKQLLPLPPALGETWIVIENIYEPGPETLADLLARLPSPPYGFCLDTGHFQIFSKAPLPAWIQTLGPWLREVHLHDNAGVSDDHLPPGSGRFDFPALFALLAGLAQPVVGTVEMHSVPHIVQALAALERYGVL